MSMKINVTNELLFELQNVQMNFLPWQSRWYQTRFNKSRSLHKARQIGADYYFLFEALQDACLTGRDKIFIGYVPVDCLRVFAGVKKTAIQHNYHFKLSNDANIYILHPDHIDKCTWGGIAGDVYISEWAWIYNLKDVMQLAEAFSMHDKHRVTLYSSRSKNDYCSQFNSENLCISLLGHTYYQDAVQCSEYELGHLYLDNRSKYINIANRHGDDFVKEVVFCGFNQK